jgi:hypothetical protein
MLQKAITFLIRPPLRPWMAWAESDGMRQLLKEAMTILDGDHDGRVSIADLAARSGQNKHDLMMKNRQLRALFAVLEGVGPASGEVRRTRMQELLQGLTAEQLAGVIAEMPRWLETQPAPGLIGGMPVDAIAASVTQELNAMLARIQAPHLEPDVAIGLVSAWSSNKSASLSKR